MDASVHAVGDALHVNLTLVISCRDLALASTLVYLQVFTRDLPPTNTAVHSLPAVLRRVPCSGRLTGGSNAETQRQEIEDKSRARCS